MGPADDIRISAVAPDTAELAAVVALADANRDHLGHMPRGAFTQFARVGDLLAATNEVGTVLGYVLFSFSRGRIRLAHLCVDAHSRGRGIGRLLLSAVVTSHSDAPCVVAKCRVDFEVNSMWPALGFQALGEVPGKKASGSRLTFWRLDLGAPDLFSLAEGDVSDMVVAIDHNVFIDLEVDRSRHGADESLVLEADWLAAQYRLAVTAETLAELNRLGDAERSKQRDLALSYPSLAGTFEQFEVVSSELRHLLPGAGVDDASDFRHLVHSICGGAAVFVTRDQACIERYARAIDLRWGMRVLRPSDFVTHLDELQNAHAFQPRSLRGTGYQLQRVGTNQENRVLLFLARESGETSKAFLSVLRGIATAPGAAQQAVVAPSGEWSALWSERLSGEHLVIDLLRIAKGTLRRTLLRSILHGLKETALRLGADSVLITDVHIGAHALPALEQDGFRRSDFGWRSLVPITSETTSLNVFLAKHLESPIAYGLMPGAVASVERQFWPAKLLDQALPCYLIPIQEQWANRLLHLTEPLWGDTFRLGLNREHVYFRTPKGNPLAPARLLWYVSGKGGGVVAASQLVDVSVAPAVDLFRRFRRLGVYELEHVQQSERDGLASALSFMNTEIFNSAVPYRHLIEASPRLGTLQSPTRVSADLFARVISKGEAL